MATSKVYLISLRVQLKSDKEEDIEKSNLYKDINDHLNKWGNDSETEITKQNASAAQFSKLVATSSIDKALSGIIAAMQKMSDASGKTPYLAQFWLDIQLVDNKFKNGLVLPLVDASQDQVREYLGIGPRKRSFRFWPFGRRD